MEKWMLVYKYDKVFDQVKRNAKLYIVLEYVILKPIYRGVDGDITEQWRDVKTKESLTFERDTINKFYKMLGVYDVRTRDVTHEAAQLFIQPHWKFIG